MKDIVVIDYGLGNIKSMMNALEKVGAHPILTNEERLIMAADAVVLPGVGAFRHGMENLAERGLTDVIKKYVQTEKPFLGVCLGMQLLMDESDEFGLTEGLGIIEGRVEKVNLSADTVEKLPHVSWNELEEPSDSRWKGTIFNNQENSTDVYFVHSFAANPKNQDDVLANCTYGDATFCAAVHHKNVYGTQFHPEKSGATGLQILKNFLTLIK